MPSLLFQRFLRGPIRRWSARVWLPALAVVLVVAWAAPRAHGPWQGGDAQAASVAAPRSAPLVPRHASYPSSDLDDLRIATAMGDAEASAALVRALLDFYDAGAGPAPLVEALQWLQRDAETPAMLASGQVQRLVAGACRSDPLLRWNWLCNEGE